MKPEEKDEVSRFVNMAMQRAYGCDAHPLPKKVFIARQHGVLVGTLAVAKCGKGRLPLESIYDFAIESREKTIQLGRWVSLVPAVSELLLHHATEYGLAHGFSVAISEVKPKVARHFRRLGISLEIIQKAPRLERISSLVRPYYDPPLPLICIGQLQIIKENVEKRIAKNVLGHPRFPNL